MFCVKCGVELADSERTCPLCNTPVYYPNLQEITQRTYPKYRNVGEHSSGKGINFVIAVGFVLAIAICILCDIDMSGSMEWSDYVIFGATFAYVVIFLPMWFRKPSPAVFVPCDFLAAALLLFYINWRLGGDWFISFAMPITAFIGLIVCSVVILSYYLRAGYLYIYGGASILFSIFFVVMELLLHMTFDISHTMLWSFYPATAFFILGISLIVIAIVPAFRESLRKIFSI